MQPPSDALSECLKQAGYRIVPVDMDACARYTDVRMVFKGTSYVAVIRVCRHGRALDDRPTTFLYSNDHPDITEIAGKFGRVR